MFRDIQNKTLMTGWWGVISFFVNIAYVFMNVGQWSKIQALGEPHPTPRVLLTPARTPLPPGRKLIQRPGIWVVVVLLIILISSAASGAPGNGSSTSSSTYGYGAPSTAGTGATVSGSSSYSGNGLDTSGSYASPTPVTPGGLKVSGWIFVPSPTAVPNGSGLYACSGGSRTEAERLWAAAAPLRFYTDKYWFNLIGTTYTSSATQLVNLNVNGKPACGWQARFSTWLAGSPSKFFMRYGKTCAFWVIREQHARGYTFTYTHPC